MGERNLYAAARACVMGVTLDAGAAGMLPRMAAACGTSRLPWRYQAARERASLKQSGAGSAEKQTHAECDPPRVVSCAPKVGYEPARLSVYAARCFHHNRDN
jgi:hypothetical protein